MTRHIATHTRHPLLTVEITRASAFELKSPAIGATITIAIGCAYRKKTRNVGTVTPPVSQRADVQASRAPFQMEISEAPLEEKWAK